MLLPCKGIFNYQLSVSIQVLVDYLTRNNRDSNNNQPAKDCYKFAELFKIFKYYFVSLPVKKPVANNAYMNLPHHQINTLRIYKR